MKQKTEIQKKVEKVFFGIGVFVIFYLLFILYQFKFNYLYKIGTAINYCKIKNSVPGLEVEYIVNNKRYTVCQKQGTSTKLSLGDLIYVRVSKYDPSISCIDFEKSQTEKSLRG